MIGAGQMGNGISHVCAAAGIDVVMLDVKAEALDKAVATMGRNMDRQVSKGTLAAEDRDAALARIVTSTDYAAFGDCDLVIEAATEKEELKRAILSTLVPHLSARRDDRLQHLVDLHHPARRRHRPAGDGSSACIS